MTEHLAMSNLSEQITELISNIRALQPRTHAEIGVVGAAIIEEQLLRALLTKMRPLSGEMKKRLFDGYGPLSSFSAKIDLSYALQILNKDQYDDLTVIRRIRSQFGHSMPLVNFDKPEMREHFKRFKTLQAGGHFICASCRKSTGILTMRLARQSNRLLRRALLNNMRPDRALDEDASPLVRLFR